MEKDVMAAWQAGFGVDPPRTAPQGADRWARAVELGARGHAAAARTVLAALIADPRVGDVIRSLALSTRASLTRQAGRHAAARADDGAALRTAVAAEQHAHAGAASEWAASARIDALVGLAADSLGIGDFSGSRRLLAATPAAASHVVDDGVRTRDDGPMWVCRQRSHLRRAWVRTELALYTGDDTAKQLATQALALAEHAPSPRHRIKTALIAAAAAAAAGETDCAAQEAHRLARACREAQLVPLEWAAGTMLDGLRPGATDGRSPEQLRQILITRGMRFAPAAGLSAKGR